MGSFNYLLKGNFRFLVLFFFMSFIAVNCQNGCGGYNGCTTSVIVDQESRKQKVDGVRIEITANKNRVTNRKLRINEDIKVDKTIWYTVDYYLEVDRRPEIKNICEFDIPENVDLKKALTQFNIKFSPDKKHFAVGLNNKVYDFFHLLKDGVPFSSGCYYVRDSNDIFLSTANIDFNKINWKNFPSPEILFDTVIVPNNYAVWALECNKNNVLSLLDDMPPGNKHEMVLIENWFCEIADLHFTKPRVDAIIKVSPAWKKAAIKSLTKAIGNAVSENDEQLDESLSMILWINDANALNVADSIAFDDYFAAGYAGNYWIERFKNKKLPIDKKMQTALLSKAKYIGSNFQEETDNMSQITAIDILLICKENEIIKGFINKNIQSEILLNDFFDISACPIRHYEAYSKDLQAIIVKRYLEVAQKSDSGLSGFNISEIVEFLKDKISCDELKKIVEMHKSDLSLFRMPDGC